MNKNLKSVSMVGAALLVVGLLIAGIAVALGAPRNYYWDGGLRTAGSYGTLVTEEFSGEFDSLELKLGVYSLEIERTNGEYGVEYTYPANQKAPNISLQNNTLEFTTGQNRNNNSGILRNGPIDDKTWVVKIRYPRDKTLNVLEIDKSLGDINLSKVDADEMDISLACGSLKLDDCKANNAELKVSLGELHAVDFVTNGLEADAQCGDIYLDGTFRGSTELDNSLGSIRFTTTEPRDTYALDVSVNVGDVTVDGISTGRRERDKDSNFRENNLEASCSVGSIIANFGK